MGMVRATNEDALFPPRAHSSRAASLRGRLWAVADGMGGHSGGRIASGLACRSLQRYYDGALAENGVLSARALCRHLTETFFCIDRCVRRQAACHKSWAHMGTTLSCLLLFDGRSIIAHVGDSRIYRWRRGHLSCLTTDHTFVQEMIFEGELDPANALTHPLRHLLTNAVGTLEPLEYVDSRIDRIQPGDRFLVCTDGLYNAVAPKRIDAIIASGDDAAATARALVAEALVNQTPDNVTALTVFLNGTDRFYEKR